MTAAAIPATPVVRPSLRARLWGLGSVYGKTIRRLRTITNKTVNKEPKWRHNDDKLTTGYEPRWGN